MNTPLLYSIVPIAPSKTMTCCGSSSRVISGFSGNGSLRLTGNAGARAANGVVLGVGMMDDHCCSRLLGQELKCLGELHPQRFPGGEKLEDGDVIIQVGTRTVAP